jgi:oligopeptide/dipeptide ABC transporter ATP-binding protein
VFQGTELTGLRRRALTEARRQMQMVYQDPFGSLNPRWRVTELVEEPLRGYGVRAPDRRRRVGELLDLVGLDPSRYGRRRPHELSGGQCQRVMVAMALACSPALLIADEPTTALDVTVEAEVLQLIRRLGRDHRAALLLVTHDMGIVAEMADRVVVMYAGRKVEEAQVDALFEAPAHPYTRGLMASMPHLGGVGAGCRRLAEIPGIVPALTAMPPGCAFAPRCRRAVDLCRAKRPPLVVSAPDHLSACHFHAQLRTDHVAA